VISMTIASPSFDGGDRTTIRGFGRDVADHEASDELNQVGDDLATHERCLHALSAHRDSVCDGGRVEFDRRTAGIANTALDLFSELGMVSSCTA
jgi:hypothetical protein